MDYKNMIRISKLIKEMSTKDNIIFIVSHDVEFLNETADSILCLEEFKIPASQNESNRIIYY